MKGVHLLFKFFPPCNFRGFLDLLPYFGQRGEKEKQKERKNKKRIHIEPPTMKSKENGIPTIQPRRF